MAAVHWQAPTSAFFVLLTMKFLEGFVIALRKPSCQYLWCNGALEKDGVEGGLGSVERGVESGRPSADNAARASLVYLRRSTTPYIIY
jgi:hypothetical protein